MKKFKVKKYIIIDPEKNIEPILYDTKDDVEQAIYNEIINNDLCKNEMHRNSEEASSYLLDCFDGLQILEVSGELNWDIEAIKVKIK